MSGEGGTAPSRGLARVLAAVADYRPEPGGDELIGLRRLIDLLELEFSTAAAAFASSTEWEEAGHATPIQWLRWNCRMASGTAAERVRAGCQVGRMRESCAALGRGEIGFAHLALMAGLAEASPAGFQEPPLLDRAREETVTRFRKTCEHVRHAQDPDGFAAEAEEGHQDRFLELSPQDNGALWLRGWRDPEGASVLRSALEPLARLGKADGRLRRQRLADALVEAVSGGQESELVVTTSVETLLGLRGSGAAETEWGGLLSSATIERYACHAALRRVVLDEHSVVIELGRRQRLISPQARRALEARDKHCVWPGCDRPARWCEAHHREPWMNGGRTDVGGLVLICRHHHRRIHEGGWRLVPKEGGDFMAIPPLGPPRQVDIPAA